MSETDSYIAVDIKGFGASFIRELNGWQFYTMPGAKEFPLFLKGYDKARVEFVVKALNAAISASVPPLP